MKKMNLNPCVEPYIKINSRWTTDINVKGKTIKLLEENIIEYIRDLQTDKN